MKRIFRIFVKISFIIFGYFYDLDSYLQYESHPKYPTSDTKNVGLLLYQLYSTYKNLTYHILYDMESDILIFITNNPMLDITLLHTMYSYKLSLKAIYYSLSSIA